MVELEPEAKTTPVTANSASPENKFCRLCLEESDLIVNLFEEQVDEDETTKIALSQKLFDLFQIKYEEAPSLPNKICKNCLHMVKSFSIFRENVHKIESELQKRIATLKYGGLGIGMEKIIENPTRAGLNGEPGIFIPENGAVIIDVNPEEEYESSDDEFSMDSDSETDELHNVALLTPATSVPSTTGTMNNAPTDSLIKTSQNNALSTDVEMTTAPTTHVNFTEKDSCILITSNIVEKSYNMEGARKVVTYSCQYCDISFSDQTECADHVSRHDPTGPYLCNFCSQRYLDRQHLINHIRENHDSERPYICAICKKGFMRRTDLRKHSIVHTGVRPYTCVVCGKGFSRNTNLTKHLRVHSSVRPHSCTRCPRSFSTVEDLNRHTRTHLIHKPFHCSRCSASFTRKDKLAQHEMTHLRRDNEFLKNRAGNLTSTQPNPNPLIPIDDNQQQQQHHMETMVAPLNPYAGSSEQIFNAQQIQSDDPYRHSILAAQLQQPLTSTFSKPTSQPPTKQSHFSRHFACEICSQTFTRERDYQRHQALHLDKLFSCKQCGKGFSRREKLARHELEQHGPQYPCNICRIPFTKLSEYELHMKMHELQHSVAVTAQAASMLSAGVGVGHNNYGSNQQQLLQVTQQQQQQLPPPAPVTTAATKSMLPPPSKEFLGLNQRPSAADMTFFSQMVPTMNLGFYSETRPEDRNGI